MPESLRLLRAAAFVAVMAGAIGSVSMMLRASRHNDSQLFMTLFTIWVLSPFVAFIVVNAVSRRWSMLTRTFLYILMLVVALGSLAIYGGLVPSPPTAKPAFFFVVVPPVSWLLLAIVPAAAGIANWRLRRRGRA